MSAWSRRAFLTVCVLALSVVALAQDIKGLVKRVKPAVVTIEARQADGTSLGTGFVIVGDGVVLTAQHVIADASQVRCRFSDGKEVGVRSIIMEDTEQDFALLQLDAGTYPTVPLGQAAKLEQGDRVVVIGNPNGLSFSVSQGIVSALRSPAMSEVAAGQIPAYIQYDAATNPGNSGGPIFNEAGEAVGVVVFKRKNAENLNFAVAIDRVQQSIRERSAAARPPAAAAAPPARHENWFVVMSETAISKSQEQTRHVVDGKDVLAGADGDESWLKKRWKEGFQITDIAEGDSRWMVCLTKNCGFTNRSVLTDTEFPREAIKREWDKGLFITSAVFSSDRWVVILSQFPETTARQMSQRYILGKEFPEERIKQMEAEGYRVTIVNGDNDRCLVVATKGLGYGTQRWRLVEGSPRDWIRQGWGDDYYITAYGYLRGQRKYAIVMSKSSGFTHQSYWSGDFFPDQWVKEKWDLGWNITYIR